MKSIYSFIFILVTINFFGQVIELQSAPNANISSQNPFFDASSYDLSVDASSTAKGMVFPRTDLTTWTFTIDNL